jgi:hypothetical protein
VHGDALHFLDRVRRYAVSHGHPQSSAEALMVYPRALATDGLALATLALLAAVATLAFGDSGVRKRAARACGAGLALFAFLELGALRSGVPTHHAVRTLVPIAFLSAPLVVEALASRGRTLAPTLGPLLVIVVAGTGRWSRPPGTGADNRTAALEVGATAARRGEHAITLAHCGFEHFAAIAAFGKPERVHLEAQRPGGPCPELLVRRDGIPYPEP